MFPRLIKTSLSAVTIVRRRSFQLKKDVRRKEPVLIEYFFFFFNFS